MYKLFMTLGTVCITLWTSSLSFAQSSTPAYREMGTYFTSMGYHYLLSNDLQNAAEAAKALHKLTDRTFIEIVTEKEPSLDKEVVTKLVQKIGTNLQEAKADLNKLEENILPSEKATTQSYVQGIQNRLEKASEAYAALETAAQMSPPDRKGVREYAGQVYDQLRYAEWGWHANLMKIRNIPQPEDTFVRDTAEYQKEGHTRS